jgi:hypothetical protein
MADLSEIYYDDLALFRLPPRYDDTQGTEWVTYRPINQLTEGSALEFNIPATSTQYVDLKLMHLHVKAKITKSDGTALVETGDDADNVGEANAPLHTMFSQVDLDLLFDTDDNQELLNQLFVKDDPGMDDGNAVDGTNRGLWNRSKDNVLDLIGGLKLDVCQQDRLILNVVPINLKLWQSNDSFRLMAKDKSENYKLKIMEASLRVAIVKVNPGILIGHADSLKEESAQYPYTSSVLKNFAILAGQFSFTVDDLFQGEVPGRLILGLISSSAMHGDVKKIPST